jgi:hypothetical protein
MRKEVIGGEHNEMGDYHSSTKLIIKSQITFNSLATVHVCR